MYGQIHDVVQELVLERFGEETWNLILEESGFNDEDFLIFRQYPDSKTMALHRAVSKVLKLPMNEVLEMHGEHFLLYCLRHGYDKMLLMLARDLVAFIQNLDSLHSHLLLSHKHIKAPSFRCETNSDGTLNLHYHSVRPGLYPVVFGILKAVGRYIFGQEVQMSVISKAKEQFEEGTTQYHYVLHVVILPEGADEVVPLLPGSQDDQVSLSDIPDMPTSSQESPCFSRRTSAASPRSSIPMGPCPFHTHLGEDRDAHAKDASTFALSPEQFCSVFPFHIVFDASDNVMQCGENIEKLLRIHYENSPQGLLGSKDTMELFFRLHQPRMEFKVSNIRQFINAEFLVGVSYLPNADVHQSIMLKGQMIWLKDSRRLVFIGSPRVSCLNELRSSHIFLSDIPLYDVTRELIVLNQERLAEVDAARKLDEVAMELMVTSRELEREKEKAEKLFYQMLPVKVAETLKNGNSVDAEKFKSATVLCSDIVKFTTMAMACTPMQVVGMLNELFKNFDRKCNEREVLKLETIGDAYMVVDGVPEPVENHAESVCLFALDITAACESVVSPATNEPVQIRVGIHTGPVVAGVVGVKMPRYCLFGDTVNIAFKMESYGTPGRIQVSSTTFDAVRGRGFSFRSRGEKVVESAGKMALYFLLGRDGLWPKEPDDVHTILPLKKH